MQTKKLTEKQRAALLETLQVRFAKHKNRHKGVDWGDVEKRLRGAEAKLWSLHQMDDSGGEPDVVGVDKAEVIFMDCAAESPSGRRSVCYDAEALASRKENKPKHSALGFAAEIGVEVLTEEQYRELQKHGPFDQKTSSWVKTPADIRALGGALFGDYRYGKVFIYHNGAESYYAARGFRAVLRV